MAKLLTAIADIYEPEPWSLHFIEEITSKSVFMQSGMVDTDEDLADKLAGGGRRIDLPFYLDLGHDESAITRSSIADDSTDEITPSGVADEVDEAYVDYRTKSWQVSSIVKHTSGSDPVQVVLARYVNWWIKEEQRLLISKLAGVQAELVDTHVNSIAIEDGANATADELIGNTAIENTRFLLGDNYSKFAGMIMHSVPFQRLRALDLIETIPISDQNSEPIELYNSLRVLVDDKCPAVAGSTSGFKYTTYLFGRGSVSREQAPQKPGDTALVLVKDEKVGQGAGSLDIITRDYLVLHPRGVAFTGTPAGTTPTNTELELGSNWTQKYTDKNIRLAFLVTNG